MFSALRGERTPLCISDLRLDAWFGKELDSAAADAITAHLEACGRCRTRKLQLLRQRMRFELDNPDLPGWLTQSPQRRKSRWKWIAPGLVAAAAALLLLLPQTPSVRSKGYAHLGFYVKRGEHVHRGKLRERLMPGDKLRFAYTAVSPGYLAILSLDGAGHASTYFPAGSQAAWIDAGADVLLPSAVELDDAVGEERIVGLFCETAVPVAPLLAALQSGRLPQHKPDDCTLDELTVIKQAP